MTSSTVSLFIPEEKKYRPGTNQGSDLMKNLFNYYDSIGNQQVWRKNKKYRKLYNLVSGIINIEDYIEVEKDLGLNFSEDKAISNIDLMFYPLVPLIWSAISGEYQNKDIKYGVRAVNPENTSIILESMTKELVSVLIDQAEALFTESNPNAGEQEKQQFMQSEKIQKFYSTKFRTKFESWANHIMKVEDQRFNMKKLETDLLQQIFTTADPNVHVAYSNGHYFPEILREKDCFRLISPKCDDNSDSMMFGWYDYCNISTVMNRWGDMIAPEDLHRLEKWSSNYSGDFVTNDLYDAITGNRTRGFESTQNYLTFKQIEREGSSSRYDEYGNSPLVKETHMYFLLPRMKAYVTYKSAETEIKQIVDTTFVPTLKAKYEKGKPKTLNYLIEGEHVEWFYENELMYGVKLDYNSSFSSGGSGYTGSGDANSIWVTLGKHEVQYSANKMRYGTRIPVHGGQVNNIYNQSVSPAEKCFPWQIMYNWIWNRGQQLISNEVGKFLVLNELAIPSESLENSWGLNPQESWLINARDNQLATLDPSIGNAGQAIAPQLGSIAQVVDMTKTQEIIEKGSLARMVKEECFNQLGLTTDYIYGKIEPRMSAQMVAMGNQRSSTQLVPLYRRLEQVMVHTRTTMLETAQFIEASEEFSNVSYTTDDGQREIFRVAGEDLTLGKLDIFVTSSITDASILERLKQLVLSSNALNMDAFELAASQTSTTIPEMLGRLKEAVRRKEALEAEKQQQQQQMHEQQIQAQQQMQQQELLAKKEDTQSKNETAIITAQIRALGFANDDAESIQRQMLELQTANRTQQEFYNKVKDEEYLKGFNLLQEDRKQESGNKDRDSQERIKMAELKLKNKELGIREREVIASNKRTSALSKKKK